MISNQNFSISATSKPLMEKAQNLSNTLDLAFELNSQKDFQLMVTENHIELRAHGFGSPIWIDFIAGKNAHRRKFGGGRGQALAKAVSLKNGKTPTLIDCTAGFGRDAFVLATLGCHITLIERNSIIATLLQDAIERARNDPETAEIAHRMQLHNIDAKDYLKNLDLQQRPDVIYIDPMYPSRDKSALVKKDMQLLHKIIGPDTDNDSLLTIAQNTALKRVVVKRPKTAQPLTKQKPSAFIESKNTRYDIYLSRQD
jgi:16S rRNA (guanine1516-N2)-methyltransferase